MNKKKIIDTLADVHFHIEHKWKSEEPNKPAPDALGMIDELIITIDKMEL